MAELTTLLGYILAALMAVLAFVCWRKAMGFHTLLMESSSRFEALKQHASKAERENTKLAERNEALKEANLRFEKQLNANKSKIDGDFKRMESRALEAEDRSTQMELKLDHLRPQVEALTRQLSESEQALKEAQTKLSYASAAVDKRVSAAKEDFDKQLEDAKRRYKELEQQARRSENELSRVRKAAGDLDPEKIKDIARKASHFENLYRSMRGLREMADERNKNWEVALGKLSSWILNQQKPRLDSTNMTLGPMVGAALELIGERLVQDEFSEKSAGFVTLEQANPKMLDLDA